MLYDKIKKDEDFSNVTSTMLSPSSALCYIGYENNVSGKITLKLKSSDQNISDQSLCSDAKVVPLTLSNTTNLNYQLGDIFYAGTVNAGNYTITVSKLGGAELKGKSIMLYLNEVPANTTFSFGGTEIISTSETGSYCATFSNLLGTNDITCISVWRTPGAIGTVQS